MARATATKVTLTVDDIKRLLLTGELEVRGPAGAAAFVSITQISVEVESFTNGELQYTYEYDARPAAEVLSREVLLGYLEDAFGISRVRGRQNRRNCGC